MRPILFLLCAFTSGFSVAQDLTVMDSRVEGLSGATTDVTAVFVVNQETRTVSARVIGTEKSTASVTIVPTLGTSSGALPLKFFSPRTVVVLDELIPLKDVELIDNKVIYFSPAGQIDCGTTGKTRILRRPVLKISGNCELSASFVGKKRESRILVKLIAK
jgi:hypothetical protein